MNRPFEDLFSKSGLSLDRLRTLRDFAEYGSYSAIAPQNLPLQSQYSRQISQLEEFFGVKLVEKVGRGLQLTQEGKELARITNENLRELKDFLSYKDGGPVEFKIGAATHNLESIVIPRLVAFLKKNPTVKFEFINMRSEPIATALRESKIDFGVVRPNALSHPIKHKPVDSVGYLLFGPSGVDLDKALKLPLALSNNSEFKQSIEENAVKAKVKLNTVFTCSSFNQCETLLRKGIAVTILPNNMKDRLKDFSSHQPKWIQKYQRKISVAWRVGMLGAKGRLAEDVKEALLGE